MQAAFGQDVLETVTAPVQFTVATGEKPIALVHQPGDGPDQRTGSFVQREITIHNGRPIADQLDLDREGFLLLQRETAVVDLYDDEEVRRVYHLEMEALIKELTGASKVIVFDHTRRIDDPAAQAETKVRGPATIVHNDFTVSSAAQRVRDLLPQDEAEERLKKRYGSINAWRPIRGPVQTAPLMVCGYDSLADKDLITSERHYPDGRIGNIYHVAYNPTQRWYYFPEMERDEILLLKCFDSSTDGTARWTAHGSFQPPNRPANTAPRESIEVRTLLFYDNAPVPAIEQNQDKNRPDPEVILRR